MKEQGEGGNGERNQIIVDVGVDEEGLRRGEHFHNFGVALQQAVNDAADQWGPGTHTASLQLVVTFRKVNPGEIGGYRIVLG
jgi:hypothetical protein